MFLIKFNVMIYLGEPLCRCVAVEDKFVYHTFVIKDSKDFYGY